MALIRDSSPELDSAQKNISQEPTTGVGFDYFWRYAAERQQIYLRRQAGQPAPWSDDAVLSAYRFTNVYRASDRVSQYLISRVQYDGAWDWQDTFVRTLVFKFFNRPRTWEYLLEQLGEVDTPKLMNKQIDRVLASLATRQAIYNPAYIMPPPNWLQGPKFERHLELIRLMVKDGAHLKIQAASDLKSAFQILRDYPSLGDFLAYQFIIDLNYSSHLAFHESEFVVAGPGARRGLRKCFVQRAGLTDSQLIAWTARRQANEFVGRGLPWVNLGTRSLQLIDIQNIFCELDKYTRLACPQLSSLVAGKRIKQRYRPLKEDLTAHFPPKWGIKI